MPRAAASPLDRDDRSSASSDIRSHWAAAFRAVRAETERRAAPLSPEDQVVQSMPDASPTKWHRAHTTWFFEQFLLTPHVPDYRVFDERFAFLFNSYYVAAGPRHARPERGLVTRPNAEEVAAYRAHVDRAVLQLIETADDATIASIAPIVEIGLNHEQQHQELLITDMLHAFAQNPTESGLRFGVANAANQKQRRLRRSSCRHSCDRTRRRGLLLRQRTAGASGAAARCCDLTEPRDQRRVAGVHGRRRLRQSRRSGCRMAGTRSRPKAGPHPDTGGRSTAPGSA